MYNEIFGSKEVFEKFVKQFPAAVEPVTQFSQLAVAQWEKWVDLQLDVYGAYVELGLGQVKAASEIKDWDSLNAFCSKQAEVFNTLRDKQIDYVQALAKLGLNFSTEAEQLSKQTVESAKKLPVPQAA